MQKCFGCDIIFFITAPLCFTKVVHPRIFRGSLKIRSKINNMRMYLQCAVAAEELNLDTVNLKDSGFIIPFK